MPQIAEIAVGGAGGGTTVICPPATLLAAASGLGIVTAAHIFAIAGVDGGLVGGAPLRVADFLLILHALSGAKP